MAGARVGAESLDRLSRLAAEHELQLPELVRLESARRGQPVAERQELERRHRLEDVDLRDQHLEDGQDPLQRVLRPRPLVLAQQRHDPIELVQQLLEPELVDLVNDDEEDLVVFVGAWLLQLEELVDLQIAAVGDGRGLVSRLIDRPRRSGDAAAESRSPYFSTLRVFML